MLNDVIAVRDRSRYRNGFGFYVVKRFLMKNLGLFGRRLFNGKGFSDFRSGGYFF